MEGVNAMSDRSEFDERSDKVIRNDIVLARILRELNAMFATTDNTDFGVSTHEVVHACSVIEAMKARTGKLLAELHPGDDQ